MLNHIVIMGRLARDPELRYTETGIPVASFSLAVDRDIPDKDTGERIPDWVDVTAWRKNAEFAGKYLAKGQMAVVEGRLRVDNWTDKEGYKRRSTKVVAENIYFGDSKRPEAPAPSAPDPAQEDADAFSDLPDVDSAPL